MKKMIIAFVTGSLLIAGIAKGQSLTVVVRAVKNDQGVVRVGIYTSEKEFMKTFMMGKATKAKTGEVELKFDNVPAGSYAVSVFHDANENGKLDSNFVGIPKEGFGFSNDAMGSLGPPSFEEAKFTFEGEKKIELTLKYF